MKELSLEELPNFSILGLKQICSHNRDILHGFNRLPKTELILLINKKLIENCIIIIPPYVYTDKKSFLS